MLPSRSGSGGRSLRARAHIDPDDAAALARGVGDRLDFGLEVRLSAGSLGMSMQLPAVSNFQPW